MYQLGETFFRQYYRTFLRERWALIVCAVNEQDEIIGFNSGTLKAEEHISAMKKGAFWLGLAALPAVFRKPRLFFGGLIRFKSLFKSGPECDFGIREGPRGDYWAWDPANNNPGGALEVHEKFRQVMRTLGAICLRSEVDAANSIALRSQLLLGGRITHRIRTPDGRERCILEFSLTNPNSKPTQKGFGADSH